jgi:hypothetical protein
MCSPFWWLYLTTICKVLCPLIRWTVGNERKRFIQRFPNPPFLLFNSSPDQIGSLGVAIVDLLPNIFSLSSILISLDLL